MNRHMTQTTSWEKQEFGEWTLFRLDPQENGEKRWSLDNKGVKAYLTCDESMALKIANGIRAIEVLARVKLTP